MSGAPPIGYDCVTLWEHRHTYSGMCMHTLSKHSKMKNEQEESRDKTKLAKEKEGPGQLK